MIRLHGALALALALVCVPAARADIVISNDAGGSIDRYIDKYKEIARSGERIVISGYCNSACTLLFGIVPRKQVCVQRGATLGFHSAWIWPGGEYSASYTRLMWRHYPEDVRAMLRKRGWNGRTAHPDVISIDARAVFRACP